MYKFLNLTIVLILTSAHTLTRKKPQKEQTSSPPINPQITSQPPREKPKHTNKTKI